jgi:hypothetical protein
LVIRARFRGDLKPRMTVLARASNNLTEKIKLVLMSELVRASSVTSQ